MDLNYNTLVCVFRAVDILDNMMEEYVGIRDRDLCKMIFDSGCESADSSIFHDKILQGH